MTRIAPFGIILAAGLALAAPQARAREVTITTPEALARYLHDTPIERSPLGALPPGARRRFLGSLKFGPRGLAGFAIDDLDQELDHAQAEAVLTLFGAEKYGAGVGLSAQEYAQRKFERATDAAVRGCTAGSCPETPVEQRFDALQQPGRSGTDADRHAAISADYARLFTGDMSPVALARSSTPDLRLLARAARMALDADPDGRAGDDLARVLDALQQRGMANDTDYLPLFRAHVAARRFDAAQALMRDHPAMSAPALPTLRDHTVRGNGPTLLTVRADGRHMIRENAGLDVPLRIVVVAGCHFSEDAVRAIAADPQLDILFRQHAIWLASDTTALADAAAWNRAFPTQPVHIAWHDREWTMLSSWAMPTYYVFRHGREVAHWAGWLGLDALRAELTGAGVPY
ncbi:hypothetical protein [Dyella sp.]|jgi:hypothetical protein|uniref:hypothetical protein n=1 Tax=Dyella sp. TaxID=1869338 RepID=UPI002D779306|nr:hypothetical protein [Dyella sp.]HET6432289.1 hypothetical protein [Dyella sp.]